MQAMVAAIVTADVSTMPLVKRSGESLTAMVDNKDGKYSLEQQRDATEKLNAREYAAFGHLAGSGSSWGMRDFLKAYVKYVENLSPEDQQSDRYRGSLGPVKAQISEFDSYIRNNNIPDTRKGGGSKEKIPDSPIVEMLKSAEESLAKHAAKRTKELNEEKTSEATPVNVTLSTAALEILKASAPNHQASNADTQAKQTLADITTSGTGKVGEKDRNASGLSKLLKGFENLRKFAN
jgi:hypothetical protein